MSDEVENYPGLTDFTHVVPPDEVKAEYDRFLESISTPPPGGNDILAEVRRRFDPVLTPKQLAHSCQPLLSARCGWWR